DRGLTEATGCAPERGGFRVDLCAAGRIDRSLASLDLTVLDMHARIARMYGDAPGADPAIGDVELAPVLGGDRVAVGADVPVVDVEHPLSLADDRLMQRLERRVRDAGLP